MSTYTPIASQTLGSTASSVTFSSIPQNYTDLVLITSTASDISADTNSMSCQFNSDTGANYSSTYLYGTGSSSAVSGRTANSTGCFIGRHNPTEYGTGVTHFLNYSNSTTYKSVLSSGGVASSLLIEYINTWRNTSPIRSMTITPISATTFDAGCTFNLYGIVSGGGYALGGDTVTTDGTYWYHTFLNSGAFVPTRNLTNVDYLVVAGGGGGGRENFQSGSGGGGGAGGLRSTVTATGGGGSLESKLSLTASTSYQVIVGSGGAGYTGDAGTGSNGSDSVFSTITSAGGGGGGGGTSARTSGMAGGSGGGAASNTGTTTYGEGTANQGYRGGSGGGGLNNAPAGGGGGAGAVGGNSTSTDGGAGGAGVAVSITGSSVTYAGGGGGCSNSNSGAGGAGGAGGGGTGATYTSANATAGAANTGGGAGGSGNGGSSSASRAGGSGIVIVRYAV
jgi:hypothetical protein